MPEDHFGVPQLQRLPPGETVRAFTLTPTHLGFVEFDVANQGLISHHHELVDQIPSGSVTAARILDASADGPRSGSVS